MVKLASRTRLGYELATFWSHAWRGAVEALTALVGFICVRSWPLCGSQVCCAAGEVDKLIWQEDRRRPWASRAHSNSQTTVIARVCNKLLMSSNASPSRSIACRYQDGIVGQAHSADQTQPRDGRPCGLAEPPSCRTLGACAFPNLAAQTIHLIKRKGMHCYTFSAH